MADREREKDKEKDEEKTEIKTEEKVEKKAMLIKVHVIVSKQRTSRGD